MIKAILAAIVLTAMAAIAQTPLSTPATVLPNAAHTVGGEVKLMNPLDTCFGDIQATTNAFTVKGKTCGNGNILLQPGNIAGGNLASVVVESPRFDTPAVTVQDNYGTFDTVNIGDRYIYSLAGNVGGSFVWKLGFPGSSTNPVFGLYNGSGSGGYDSGGAQLYCTVAECQMKELLLGPPGGSGSAGLFAIADGSGNPRIIATDTGITLEDSGGTTQISLTTLGVLTLTPLAGGGNQCLQVNNLGVVGVTGSACGSGGGGGITSISTTMPIVGGPITTTGNISCPTCMITTGGQTVTGSDQWNADQTYSANILVSGTFNLGSTSNAWNFGYFGTANAQQYQIQSGGLVQATLGYNAGLTKVALINSLSQSLMEWSATHAFVTSFANLNPSTSGTFSLGTNSLLWSDMFSTFAHITQGIFTNTGTNIALENSTGSFNVTGNGDLTVHSCTGCGGSCPTCMLTTGGQTVTGSDVWTASQTYSANILASGSPNIGSTSNAFNIGYFGTVNSQQYQVQSGGTLEFTLGYNSGSSQAVLSNSLSTPLMAWGVTGGGNITYENFQPSSNGLLNLGATSFVWSNVYSQSYWANTVIVSPQFSFGNVGGISVSGTSCSGAPTGSFQVLGGIVTHC